jgi:hypothetical protein
MGGINLYGFVGNNGVNGWDILGLDTAKRDCVWVIFFGHGSNPDYGEADSNLRKKFNEVLENKNELPCGNRFGFVGCRRASMNKLLEKAVSDAHLIPSLEFENDYKLWYDIGHPQRNEFDDSRPHGYEILKSQWEQALEDAQNELDEGVTCCKSIKVKINCSNDDDIAKHFSKNRIFPDPNCSSEKTLYKK